VKPNSTEKERNASQASLAPLFLSSHSTFAIKVPPVFPNCISRDVKEKLKVKTTEKSTLIAACLKRW